MPVFFSPPTKNIYIISQSYNFNNRHRNRHPIGKRQSIMRKKLIINNDARVAFLLTLNNKQSNKLSVHSNAAPTNKTEQLTIISEQKSRFRLATSAHKTKEKWEKEEEKTASKYKACRNQVTNQYLANKRTVPSRSLLKSMWNITMHTCVQIAHTTFNPIEFAS